MGPCATGFRCGCARTAASQRSQARVHARVHTDLGVAPMAALLSSRAANGLLSRFLTADQWTQIVDLVVQRLPSPSEDPYHRQYLAHANVARQDPQSRGIRTEVYQLAVQRYGQGETRGLPAPPAERNDPDAWLAILREITATRLLADILNRAAISRSTELALHASTRPGYVPERAQSLIRRRFGDLARTEGLNARGPLYWHSTPRRSTAAATPR